MDLVLVVSTIQGLYTLLHQNNMGWFRVPLFVFHDSGNQEENRSHLGLSHKRLKPSWGPLPKGIPLSHTWVYIALRGPRKWLRFSFWFPFETKVWPPACHWRASQRGGAGEGYEVGAGCPAKRKAIRKETPNVRQTSSLSLSLCHSLSGPCLRHSGLDPPWSRTSHCSDPLRSNK